MRRAENDQGLRIGFHLKTYKRSLNTERDAETSSA
jgi:hypothetical protein